VTRSQLQLKEAVRIRTIMHKQQQQQVHLHLMQKRVMYQQGQVWAMHRRARTSTLATVSIQCVRCGSRCCLLCALLKKRE